MGLVGGHGMGEIKSTFLICPQPPFPKPIFQGLNYLALPFLRRIFQGLTFPERIFSVPVFPAPIFRGLSFMRHHFPKPILTVQTFLRPLSTTQIFPELICQMPIFQTQICPGQLGSMGQSAGLIPAVPAFIKLSSH